MTSVIVEMNDLLKEMMVDVPSEIADDVDWSYNSWFEDLNFDGVPDFVIGGIADLLDEGTALRLYDVIGMGNAGFWRIPMCRTTMATVRTASASSLM